MMTATTGERVHYHHHQQYAFPTPLLGDMRYVTPAAMATTKCESDEVPTPSEFESIIQDYLQNLSAKKRDKALVDTQRYNLILQVLKDPRNTSISTAQFRFWVKKMFQIVRVDMHDIVYHDEKPVATREQIYSILVYAHREAHHGGRDKTSALVRRRFSWIPKELIARFVRHCPFCITRRNGCSSPIDIPPDTPPETAMCHQQHQQHYQAQHQDMFIKDPSATTHSDLPHFYTSMPTFQIYDDRSPNIASFLQSYFYTMQPPPPPPSSLRNYHHMVTGNPGASVAAAAAAAAMAGTLSHYNNQLQSPSPSATVSSSSGQRTTSSPPPCADNNTTSSTSMMYSYDVDFESLSLFDTSSTPASSTSNTSPPH